MRRSIFALLFVAVVGTVIGTARSQTPAGNDALSGAWELVSGRYTASLGKVEHEPKAAALKVIASGHFAHVSKMADGTFHMAHGGRMSVRGDTYTETLDVASVPSLRQTVNAFTFRLQGDELYLTGMVLGTKVEEIWRRAKN
jgi:hypothetical protein